MRVRLFNLFMDSPMARWIAAHDTWAMSIMFGIGVAGGLLYLAPDTFAGGLISSLGGCFGMVMFEGLFRLHDYNRAQKASEDEEHGRCCRC